MRVLVLGGYGFIGGEITRALARAGHEVVGLGRDARLARRLFADIEWRIADIARLQRSEDWAAYLHGIDAVVNASGALQNGGRDDLGAVQDKAIRALIGAAEEAGVASFVQISAPGAEESASTAFLTTKARADAALRRSALDWTIFKPALVVGRNAYGGTSLVRMLAGWPLATPLIYPDAKIQTVSADEVAKAVLMALEKRIPSRVDYDLAEDEARSFGDLVRTFRRWLGFAPALELRLPQWAGEAVARCADIAGLFGWRSPLRSTALKSLSENILADPARWRSAAGASLKSLDETLAAMPSTAQERIYARVQLALPLGVVALSLFWLVSGVMGLAQSARAAEHVEAAVGATMATALVYAGSALDILIGAALLLISASRGAAALSILVAGAYLVAGTALAPQLWLDPLGAYVKVIPAMVLGAMVAFLLEDR